MRSEHISKVLKVEFFVSKGKFFRPKMWRQLRLRACISLDLGQQI
ncbi:hypothetical protein FIC_01983 [Flavobacteriaceae bacterium 3519-10]|nr:hypothetical protein FIC_01983 [Flavobacteriaceae bacterium 3519-10]